MTAQPSRSILNNTVLQTSSNCVVSHQHISEMYDRFDSGLCDQATCNAVALALSQKWGEKVRVIRKHGLAMYRTPSETGKLPEPVYQWLEAVDRGMLVKPFNFQLKEIPTT